MRVASVLQDYLKQLAGDAEQSLALKVDVLRGNDIDVRYEGSSDRSGAWPKR